MHSESVVAVPRRIEVRVERVHGYYRVIWRRPDGDWQFFGATRTASLAEALSLALLEPLLPQV